MVTIIQQRLPAARIAAKNPQSGRYKFGVFLLATQEAHVKALPNAPEAAALQRIAGNAAQIKKTYLQTTVQTQYIDFMDVTRV